MESETTNGTSSLQLILAWGFVLIPLGWGMVRTINAAMKLFG